ncbi:MAG: STAS domain-containing protein, partial [Deltaproteobacteria bacterium]|nr:STAS domain-containing protein [Deltaproteobacteria bacterium]
MKEQKTCPFDVCIDQGSIFLRGTITSRVSPLLMDAYHQLGTGNTIVLDFSGMKHIDIPGINALIKFHLHARPHGRKIVAYGLSPYFREVFTATGIGEAIFMESSDFTQTPVETARKNSPWARPVKRLALSHVPEGAINLNIEGLRAVGPVQGFGRLWEKTYTVRLSGIETTAQEVIRTLKENFPRFQPEKNRFYPTPAGIVPGEIVVINASTPLGLICTGVWVVYADDETFTLMTPQGHPESGWVTFSAYEDQGAIVMQVQGFARASDP